jgi:hypothetical protein
MVSVSLFLFALAFASMIFHVSFDIHELYLWLVVVGYYISSVSSCINLSVQVMVLLSSGWGRQNLAHLAVYILCCPLLLVFKTPIAINGQSHKSYLGVLILKDLNFVVSVVKYSITLTNNSSFISYH